MTNGRQMKQQSTVKTWKSDNYFFDKIIKDYMKSHPELGCSKSLWYRDTPNLDYFDVDYYSRQRCRKCRVTSQLTNIHMLSNKQQQYNKLVDFKGECPDYLPETFSFTRDETHTLKHHFNNTRSWIIKPVGGSFRNGVQVVKSWEEMHLAVQKSRWKQWVLQRFISPPALCDGRKFHFRVYVLVVKTAQSLDLYIYRQGIMYFAQKPYQLTQIPANEGKNQKQGDHAEALLSGGLSTENSFVFPKKFAECFNQHMFDHNIFPQMCHIVQDTIMSVQNEIMCPNTKNPDYKCFKLLGYDILCDQNFQLYLGEINARRITFKYPPPWMKRQLYHNLLDIVLRDTVDSKNQFYHLQNYPIQEHFQSSKSKSSKIVLDYKLVIGYVILLMIALVIIYLMIKYISNVVNRR